MNKRYTCKVLRLVALLLVLALAVPMGTRADTQVTIQPRASYYLDSYNAYIYPAANGKIQAWFTVTGNYYLDSLGALTIQIFQSVDNVNWEWYKTFTHDQNPHMLSYNDYYHSGYVECQGVPGRYYKAYVCIWGGSDGDGDTRYFYTSAKKAVIIPS